MFSFSEVEYVPLVIIVLHVAVCAFSICFIVIPPDLESNSRKFNSVLFFKTYMLKPNSKLHVLFLRKNKWMNFLHVKQNAIIVVSFWLYLIVNSILVGFELANYVPEQKFGFFEDACFAVMVIYVLVFAFTFNNFSKESERLYVLEQEMDIDEISTMKKEIMKEIPGFYDPYQ